MIAEVEHLLDARLGLPTQERAPVAAVSTDSLQHSPRGCIEAAWIEEARRRLERMRTGESTPVTTEVVEHELDEIVARSFEANRAAG